MTKISQPRDIRSLVAGLGYPTDWLWAWDNYKPTILAVAREYCLSRHLEIGAGRDPLFLPDELKDLDFEVTLNNISEVELTWAASGRRKITCDIAAPTAPDILGRESHDFAYCRMVMEHVPDVARMWRNVYAVLAPGGMAFEDEDVLMHVEDQRMTDDHAEVGCGFLHRIGSKTAYDMD